MFYIVQGYRDAMINRIWFTQRLDITVYFWTLTVLLFILGTTIYRKLKVHLQMFSDKGVDMDNDYAIRVKNVTKILSFSENTDRIKESLGLSRKKLYRGALCPAQSVV